MEYGVFSLLVMNTFIIFHFHMKYATDDADFMVILILSIANYKSIKVKSIEYHNRIMIHQNCFPEQMLQSPENSNNQINFNGFM